MVWIQAVWIANFFFFALILLFIWSKIAIISKKIKTIDSILTNTEELIGGKETPPNPQ